jgi:hypothetical protein
VKIVPTKHVVAQTKNIWGAFKYLNTIVASNAPHLPKKAETGVDLENVIIGGKTARNL